jgi:hypothetical protein
LDKYLAFSAEPRPRDFTAFVPRTARAIGGGGQRKHWGRRLAALALAIAVPAFAAPSEWQPFPSFMAEDAPAPEVVPMGFETPGESFPGSAFFYVEDPEFVPAEEVPAEDDAGLPDAAAARPFVLGGTQIDKARALQCMTMAIYYEAARESEDGQRAVAQVVLNRVAHPSYPANVCGVVFQGSERTTGCQFSFTCDGSLARQPQRSYWDRARKIAAAALAGSVYKPVGLATHYHTIWIHPYWADSLAQVGTIGAHRFYRWKGLAGLPGAFTAAYAGNEPLPAPKPRSPGAEPAAAADPVQLARIYEETHPIPAAHRVEYAPAIAPAPTYSAAIEAQGGDAQFTGSRLPESGTVRDEYARSGEWISTR